MTDRIDELFATLRAETLPTVRPAGTEPLRRAARLRRATLSGAAAIAVLAVAGLAAVLQPHREPAPVADPPPAFSTETLTARVAEALKFDDPEQPEPGEINTTLGSGARESRRELLGGAYEIRMTCFGTGSVDVTVTAASIGGVPAAVVTPVVCDTTQTTVLTVPIEVPEPSGKLTVRIEPKVGGPGQAAFGWTPRLALGEESRWMRAAEDALGDTDDSLGSGSEFLGGHGTGFQHDEAEAGRYRVRAVCLGFGSLRLTLGDPAAPAGQAWVRCSATDPEPASVTYTTEKGYAYDVEPDAEARGRSAVATVVERY